MLNLIVKLALRAEDESNLAAIASELKRRIETLPPLRQENIKAVAVTAVAEEKESHAG
jgi:hypothetical protein